MQDNISNILDEIEVLKNKLKSEIALKEDHIAYEIHKGKVHFSEEVFQNQKQKITHFFQYLKEAPLLHILTAPIVYMMIIPAVILDLFLFIYVSVIFPVYKFPKILRADYIVFDRQYLGYLNFIEKLNCVYCSYFNGLMNYTVAVAARSELYFCPIKHAKKIAYTHEYYYDFLAYADAKSYKKNLKECKEKAQVKNKH
jgi:hypothetical protein